MKFIYRHLIILLVCLQSTMLMAQLRADFNMDKNGGCAPLTISFTNASAGASGTATYEWNFGNSNTSTLQNTGAVFTEEKSYTVTLTVRDGQQSSTQTKTITVYKKPTVNFSVSDNIGCWPFQPLFTSSATPGDGSISEWHWDFGDGNAQQVFSPTVYHTYQFPQTASVSLTAINNYGCSNTSLKQNMVTVLPPIKAEFTADKTMFCNAPGTIQFTNSSAGPGVLRYEWDFGDGGNSTQASPAHTYTRRGTYTVKMTVRNAEGCVDVMEKTAYINVADFTVAFDMPTLVCTGSYFNLNNNSTPVPVQNTWVIDGVNTQLTYGNSPLWGVSFATEGTHTIQLTSDFGTCQRTISRQITVGKTPELTGFIVDIKGLCGAPTRVDFRDTTAGAVSWKWNFDWYFDYTRVHSTQQSASYNYTPDNSYYVSLVVANAAGCTATTLKQIGISRPVVGIFLDAGSVDEACNSLKAKFNTRSTEAIVSYSWNFGDGTPLSTEAEPEHNFTRVGIYNVSLTYRTVNGCTGTVTYNSIKVRQEPVANFNVQALVCGNTPVYFSNATTGYVTNYIWDYGDNTSSWFNGPHQYQEEGSYNVMLIAVNGMCNDTITKTATIKVSPPFAKIASVNTTCDGSRGLVVFTDGSRQANSWQWNFGDGGTLSYTTPPATISHLYTRSGKYKVVLAVTNGSCTVKDSMDVYVLLKQNPLLTASVASICNENSLSIQQANLVPFAVPPGYSQPYYYHQVINEDGTPFNGSIYNPNWSSLPWTATITPRAPGDMKLRVVSQSIYFNCFDTSNVLALRVKGSSAAFDIVSHNTCYKSPVILRDRSTALFNVPIVKWEWSFGDGATLVKTQGGDVQHVYEHPGSYYVNLRITDADGCATSTSSYTSLVNVTGPKASFFSSSGNNVQLNTTTTFYNYTNAANTTNVTYSWNFGNGVTSTEFSPTYTFTVPGDYLVTLIAENAATQCRDTARQTITVKNFNTGFITNASFIGNYGQCAPVLARFTNTSVNFTRLVWDFGDGFSLENQTYPSHIYERPGTYIVTLYVYGYNGLEGTYKDTVHALSPSATIQADDIEGCIGHKLVLNAPTHAGASSYLWDFGNGYIVNATDSFATHQYMSAGSYSPSLIVRDISGCQAVIPLRDKIIVHADPEVTVSPAAPLVCKGVGVQLNATGANTYSWSPSQGLSDNSIATPLAIPSATTLYTVEATDQNGCKGRGEITVTVPKPFQMTVTQTADVCKGSSVQLNAAGANSYQWINITTGLDNPRIANPVATPVSTTQYTIVGYDQYSCYSDTNNVNVTVRALPTVQAGPDIQVVYGSANTLRATGSADVVRWNWSPPDFLSCTNCPSPVSRPYLSTSYVVAAYNRYNCVARDTINIKAICTDGNMYIPSAFTPNADGRNDVFGISGYGVSIIRSMRIFNRWGAIIFERKNFFPNDITSNWDGRYKGALADPGVYVYFVEMECEAGEKFERKGTVTLLR